MHGTEDPESLTAARGEGATGDLEQRVFQLETLYEIGRECAGLRSPDEVLRVMLAMVVGAFGAIRGLIFLHDAAGAVVARYARGLAAPEQDAAAAALAAGFLRAQPSSGADAWLTEAGMEVAVPFEVDDTAQGVLALGPRLAGRPYSGEERGLLQTIVRNAAVYLRTARLVDTAQVTAAELARKVQALSVMNDLALEITHQPTTHRLHGFILDRVAAAVVAEAAALLTPPGTEGGEWLVAAYTPASVARQAAAVAGAAPALAVSSLDRTMRPDGAALVDEHSREVVAPIRFGAEVLGVLWLQRATGATGFSRNDRDLVGLLANAVAVVLQNNRLFEAWLTQQQQHFRLRGMLEQYIAPSVVERLLAGEFAPPRGGTHRRLSLVRVDMRENTEFVHWFDVDVMTELMDEYLARMTNVLFRYEGTIDRFEGDAVISFFGAPEAHPDDPLRAVRTGLEMQREFAALRLEWQARHGLPPKLGIGVGIATGEAVVGNVGSAKRLQYTVSGAVANLAARLMVKAPAGTLLIDEATWQAVQEPLDLPPRIRRRRPRYVRAKGFPNLVPVYRLRLADVGQ